MFMFDIVDRSYVRRTVLLMNNRALAKSLEKCKIEIRYLMKENQALRAQSFNLEFEKNKNRVRITDAHYLL